MAYHVLSPNPSIDRFLTLSRLRAGSAHRAEEVDVLAAGKGVNVARALFTWGADVTLYAPAGGVMGEYLRSQLHDEGLPHVLVPIGGETRTNVKIWEAEQSRLTEVDEPGPPLTVEEQRALVNAVCAAVREGDWLVLSGSLPTGVSPALYLACLTEAKRRGCQVALDAAGDVLGAVLQAATVAPDVVKPNAAELGTWVGPRAPRGDFEWVQRPGALPAALRKLADTGVTYPFVSLGAAGGAAWIDGTAIRARAPEVTARNTVGCGDVFLAAVLYTLPEEGPAMALRRATALASEKAARADGLPPDWEDGERCLGQVRLEAL